MLVFTEVARKQQPCVAYTLYDEVNDAVLFCRRCLRKLHSCRCAGVGPTSAVDCSEVVEAWPVYVEPSQAWCDQLPSAIPYRMPRVLISDICRTTSDERTRFYVHFTYTL